MLCRRSGAFVLLLAVGVLLQTALALPREGRAQESTRPAPLLDTEANLKLLESDPVNSHLNQNEKALPMKSDMENRYWLIGRKALQPAVVSQFCFYKRGCGRILRSVEYARHAEFDASKRLVPSGPDPLHHRIRVHG